MTPEFASSLVIRSLRQNAEEAIGAYARRCLTAYPANFGLAQSNALLDAFTLAGLDVYRMVGEPNIASVLVCLDRPDWSGTFLVIDLGGGTFDVAIVEYAEGVCEIISVFGDNDLGGVDYDDALAAEAQRRMLAQFPLSAVPDALRRALAAEAQRTKHRLTTAERAEFMVELEHEARLVTFDWEVTRADFRTLTENLNQRVRAVIEEVIADSWHRHVDIIFLTGQGTKIFTITEVLMSMGLTDDIVDTYREDAVARGLATYTNLLGGRSDKVPLLLDLSHRGIGLRLALVGDKRQLRALKDSADGAHTVTLIERLTTIPTCRSKILTFEGDAAADVQFTLIERSKTSDDDVPIGVIRMAAPGESVRLEIGIDVDANSAIILRIFDRERQVACFIQINQFYREAQPLRLEQRIDMLLDGWAIHPIGQVMPDRVNVVTEDGLERLETIDVEQYVKELSAARGESVAKAEYYMQAADGDGQAAALEREFTNDAANLSLVSARLLIARGRSLDALPDLVTALKLATEFEAWATYSSTLNAVQTVAGRLAPAADNQLAAQLLAYLPPTTSTTDEEPDGRGIAPPRCYR